MDKVLVAGATGYLGSFLVRELKKQKYFVRALARDAGKLERLQLPADQCFSAAVTEPATLRGCCDDVDVVFSTIGITRQKDGFTYNDVDFQGNLNLLDEALRCGVRKFIYIAVLHGEKMTQLKMCAAKERFVNALENSGLEYCIIRPTGYFSDMAEFFTQAKKGRVILFGDGTCHMNPIEGDDLAGFCVDAIKCNQKVVAVGGPEVLTHNQIAETAFAVIGKNPRITHLPVWLTRCLLWFLRTFTGSKFYGPIEFLVTVLSIDMIAPKHGRHTLRSFFQRLNDR